MIGYWLVGLAIAFGLFTDLAGNGIRWGITAGLCATAVLMIDRGRRVMRAAA
ncbi:MAG: hypothetical protein GDA49_07235 [Rhodospirillales bacterium]|nr:hypothetical protein [Rhodospirillales bacterium]